MSKFLISSGLFAATATASLFLATSAFAADVGNSNTGADSDNDATVKIDNSATINQTNNTTIKNDISAMANTGDNSASKNTGDGTVSSGDISGGVSVENTGSKNSLDPSALASGDLSLSASNSQTGADSDNTALVGIDNDLDLTMHNTANVENNICALLNTGGNTADKNTGDGMVSSGDIDFTIGVINNLNSNVLGAPMGSENPGGGTVPEGALPVNPQGSVLAEALGSLPITGTSWLFMLPFVFLAIGGTLKTGEKWFRLRFGTA
jgi:hypothetical protein